MPGAYAHMTAVYYAVKSDRLQHLSAEAHRAVHSLQKYIELGCVSPDYPYLSLGDDGAAAWADRMHYERTGRMIDAGVARVRTMGEGDGRRKCLAWLMGYAAHVVTDVTIHPVVLLRVGPYEENKTAHRVCEMHQDAYIYDTLGMGPITETEQLKDGIGACGDAHGLAPDVRALWEGMLQAVHPQAYAEAPPDIDKWHRNFLRAVDGLADEGGWLPGFVMRRVAGMGIFYFGRELVEESYVKGLKVPGKAGYKDYQEIFKRAIDNVANMWVEIDESVRSGEPVAASRDWDLDTGRDHATGELTYWG